MNKNANSADVRYLTRIAGKSLQAEAYNGARTVCTSVKQTTGTKGLLS